MREQVVTFETAKLASQKGFHHMKPNIYGDNLHYHRDDPEGQASAMNGNIVRGTYLAPTLSLLQKWIRELHNINICLQPIYGGNKVNNKQIGWLCYTPHEDEDINGIPSISISEYSYEEALERGLQEVLKLIDNEDQES